MVFFAEDVQAAHKSQYYSWIELYIVLFAKIKPLIIIQTKRY